MIGRLRDCNYERVVAVVGVPALLLDQLAAAPAVRQLRGGAAMTRPLNQAKRALIKKRHAEAMHYRKAAAHADLKARDEFLELMKFMSQRIADGIIKDGFKSIEGNLYMFIQMHGAYRDKHKRHARA